MFQRFWYIEAHKINRIFLPFISLFIITPVSGTISWLPNSVLTVLVIAIVSPLLSDATAALVPLSVKIPYPSGSYADAFRV
jgi:hypothetical protein